MTMASASCSVFDALRRHFADDADGEARAGEGLAADDLVRQAELEADGTHLVLEQVAQRLDDLQHHVLRQPADVVVRLDDARRSPFDAVWPLSITSG